MTLFTANIFSSLTGIEIALIVFFAVFVIVTVRVLVRRRGHFDAAARIPLNDEVQTPRTDGKEGNDR